MEFLIRIVRSRRDNPLEIKLDSTEHVVEAMIAMERPLYIPHLEDDDDDLIFNIVSRFDTDLKNKDAQLYEVWLRSLHCEWPFNIAYEQKLIVIQSTARTGSTGFSRLRSFAILGALEVCLDQSIISLY